MPSSEQLTVPVRLKGICIERSRQFGDVYLALALWRGTGLEALCEGLLPIGKERIAWAKMAAVLVAARFCEPSSELHIAEDWYRRKYSNESSWNWSHPAKARSVDDYYAGIPAP